MLARTNNGGEMPLRLTLDLDPYAVVDLQGKLSNWESKISPGNSPLVGKMKFTYEEHVFVFKKQ